MTLSNPHRPCALEPQVTLFSSFPECEDRDRGNQDDRHNSPEAPKYKRLRRGVHS